jgi:hypothetical protein
MNFGTTEDMLIERKHLRAWLPSTRSAKILATQRRHSSFTLPATNASVLT